MENLDNTLIEEDVSQTMETILSQEQQPISPQNVRETVKEAQPEEVIVDNIEDEVQLTKEKVKDNLSDVCKRNTEKTVKGMVKADIINQCFTSELHDTMQKRGDLEKILEECRFQQQFLQNKLDLELKHRPHLQKEMGTVGMIVEVLTKKVRDHQGVLTRFKSRMMEIKKETDETLKVYNSHREAFREEFARNNDILQDCKKTLENKQRTLLENTEKSMREKSLVQQSSKKLEQELEIAKKRYEELLQAKEDRLRELAGKEEYLSKLKSELDSISVDAAERMFKRLEVENREEINAKKLEEEIWKQRMAIQLDHLNELNTKVQSLGEERSILSEHNAQLTEEVAANKLKYDQLVEDLNISRISHKEGLGNFANHKMEIEGKIQGTKLEIVSTRSCAEYVKKKLDTVKEELANASSTVSSLNEAKSELEKEIEDQKQLNETLLSKKKSLHETLTGSNEEISRLNDEIRAKQNNLTTLQFDADAKISNLTRELAVLKDERCILTRSESEFEKTKIADLEKLEDLKRDNEGKLEDLKAELKRMKDEEQAKVENVKDLSDRIRSKTDRRDELHDQFKKIQADVSRLEDEVKKFKNHDQRQAEESSSRIYRKPTAGILKKSELKSPQKKVTFDANWDSVSESSTDALFDMLLKRRNSAMERKDSMDEVFSTLKRNSPPERESKAEHN